MKVLNMFTSIIGIGISFNAELADSVTKNKASNYFCIVQEQEMLQTIVQGFAYNFFPSTFNVTLALECGSFQVQDVYGVPFETSEQLMPTYWTPLTHCYYPPDFKKSILTFLLCIKEILKEILQFLL